MSPIRPVLSGLGYDAQDRIISYGDFEYEFTDNGELATKTDIVSNEVTSYAYDALGNLRGVTLPNGDAIEYLVDGRGRRVGKKVNGVLVKQWLWRGQLQPVAELDGAGNVVARFVYADGVNVPMIMVTSTATYRFVTDHLGSVKAVLDATTGAVVQELVYDSWGRVQRDTNPDWQPFGFAGGLVDNETDFIRFGARDFDPETGRWTSKDPKRFSDTGNLYEYSHSEPINRADASGLDTFDLVRWTVIGPGGVALRRLLDDDDDAAKKAACATAPAAVLVASLDSPALGPADVFALGLWVTIVASAGYREDQAWRSEANVNSTAALLAPP